MFMYILKHTNFLLIHLNCLKWLQIKSGSIIGIFIHILTDILFCFCFIVGHNPVYLEATDAMCLCWNYSDVHDTLSEFKSCVVCFISGHDHDGGIAVDQYGIHHITMPGVIEHPESYAVGCVYEDSIKIEGKGDMFNVTCPLRFKLES